MIRQNVISQVESMLLAGFLTMEQIASKVGISTSEVEEIMMAMDIPTEE